MKIAFIGNKGNNAYRLCKWIRDLSVDAHLYLIDDDTHRSLPEEIDQELIINGYPDWIHRYGEMNRWYPLVRRQEVTYHISRTFDVAVTSGVSGVLSINYLQEMPVVHMALGLEVSELPLWAFDRKINFRKRILGLIGRRALSKASRITSGYKPTLQTIIKLNWHHKTRIWGYPEDVKGNRNRVDIELLSELNSQYGTYDRVFLWLSRLNYLDRSSPSYKGPEKFLAAFERLIAEGCHIRAIIGTHGYHAEQFQQLVLDKGLKPLVDYVPHLPYWKLLSYLSIENAVVVDELDLDKGEISGMARDALSVGTVIIKSIENRLVETVFGPGCPIIHAVDSQSCYQAMRQTLSWDAEQFSQAKSRHQQWANEFLHYERNVAQFLDILREAQYLHSIKNG